MRVEKFKQEVEELISKSGRQLFIKYVSNPKYAEAYTEPSCEGDYEIIIGKHLEGDSKEQAIAHELAHIYLRFKGIFSDVYWLDDQASKYTTYTINDLNLAIINYIDHFILINVLDSMGFSNQYFVDIKRKQELNIITEYYTPQEMIDLDIKSDKCLAIANKSMIIASAISIADIWNVVPDRREEIEKFIHFKKSTLLSTAFQSALSLKNKIYIGVSEDIQRRAISDILDLLMSDLN